LLDGIDSSAFLRSDTADSASAKITFDAGIRLNDSDILEFGSSADMEMFHNGSNGYLDLNLGDFIIRDGTTTRFTFDDAGHLTATGNINSSSDARLKTNITTLTNSLDKVLSLRGVEYDRVDNEGMHQIGVIAQEVEEVVPDLVSTDDNGMKSVAYGHIAPLLIEAIKEQQKQIEALKAEIAELKK
jgi:hypothetical protein